MFVLNFMICFLDLSASNTITGLLFPVVLIAMLILSLFLFRKFVTRLCYDIEVLTQAEKMFQNSEITNTDGIFSIIKSCKLPNGLKSSILYNRIYEVKAGVNSRTRVIDFKHLDESATDELYNRINISRFFANVAVFVGLIGTLIGLTISVGSLPMPKLDNANETRLFLASMQSIMSGFGMAFVSTLAGVIVTVVVSLLNTIYYAKCDNYLARLHKFSLYCIMPIVEAESKQVTPDNFAIQITKAITLLNNSLMPCIDKLVDATTDLTQTSDGLKKITPKFLDTAETMKSAASNFDSIFKKIQHQIDSILILTTKMDETQTIWLDKMNQSMEPIDELLDNVETIFSHIKQSYDDLSNSTNDTRELIMRLEGLFEANSITIKSLVHSNAKSIENEVIKSFEKQKDTMDIFKEVLYKHMEYADQVARMVSQIPQGLAVLTYSDDKISEYKETLDAGFKDINDKIQNKLDSNHKLIIETIKSPSNGKNSNNSVPFPVPIPLPTNDNDKDNKPNLNPTPNSEQLGRDPGDNTEDKNDDASPEENTQDNIIETGDNTEGNKPDSSQEKPSKDDGENPLDNPDLQPNQIDDKQTDTSNETPIPWLKKWWRKFFGNNDKS